MSPGEREQLLNEARHFYLVSPIMTPLLAKRKELVISGLINKHRAGQTDYAALVAELVVISDLEREIKSKEQTYQFLEEQNATARK